jgi:hypothetical protein
LANLLLMIFQKNYSIKKAVNPKQLIN